MSRIVAGAGFTNQQNRFGAFEIKVSRTSVHPSSSACFHSGFQLGLAKLAAHTCDHSSA